ncbi:hypothetical protein ACIQ9P_34095 [Kitasatospora sp. NPDC094019]|uniref:hypothetical protein n=1 Tax=Kitasatospora sp. NPDC094019 TaxID=3364091 RepID=UPI00382AF4FD
MVMVGGGTTLLVTRDSPIGSPQKQAEKVAIDWARAVDAGDIETMCGLSTTGSDSGITTCRSEERKEEAQAQAASDPPSAEDLAAIAKAWKVESSELPSDNTARVTAVRANNRSGTEIRRLVIHLTREGGGWLVNDANSRSDGDDED